jgi:hypothetical protein
MVEPFDALFWIGVIAVSVIFALTPAALLWRFIKGQCR